MTRLFMRWWSGAAIMLGAMALCILRRDWAEAALILAGTMMFLIDYLDRVLAMKRRGAR